jgi:hypothetical protein
MRILLNRDLCPSLRAKRSHLAPLAADHRDCFVAPFLAMTLFAPTSSTASRCPAKKIHNLHKPLNLFCFSRKNSGINSAKTAVEQRENSGGTATHRPQISDKKVTNSAREGQADPETTSPLTVGRGRTYMFALCSRQEAGIILFNVPTPLAAKPIPKVRSSDTMSPMTSLTLAGWLVFALMTIGGIVIVLFLMQR